MKKIMLAITMFFLSIGVVNAKMLTVTEVSNKINAEDGLVTSVVNSTDHTLDIYANGGKIVSIGYTDSYFLYEDARTPITEEMGEQEFAIYIGLSSVMDAAKELSGIVDKKLPDDEVAGVDTDAFFNTYGLQMRSEEYSIRGDGYTASGDFLRLFKHSLDTDKIVNLYNTYGVESRDIMADVKVNLTEKEVTSSSVKLSVDSTLMGTSNIYCDVYRATSENGEYVKVNDTPIACKKDDEAIFEDKNLNADTTYFYKAKTTIEDSIFGDVIQVNTLAAAKVKNPKTGVEDYLIPISLIIVCSFIGIAFANKLSYMKM